jgi:Zn-dependent M28 family amino/carboxypeptidase
VLFLLLTGEEKGLLGSTYYTDHPIVPLYRTVADLNIDGISMFDSVTAIIGVGAEYSTLNSFMDKTAKELNLEIVNIPPEFDQNESFFRSDQIAFAMSGIPSILISEGLKYVHLSEEQGLAKMINYSRNIYHSPLDDLNQQMNLDAAVQYIDIIYYFSKSILNSAEEPEWKRNSPFINERLRTIAEKR